ncbi:MAG: hypothetical protein M3217_00555 [Actinomycetota bacterium]|nr:hypothetical protein [Actinomycetota bacterium]
MPTVPFESLPDSSRIWVFGSDRAVTGEAAEQLLAEVDRFLHDWRAHGEPLRCGRLWMDNRFLVVGVDQSTANASGCSIDGLFRVLQQLERTIGARLVGGGRVYYRDHAGVPQCVSRAELDALVARGEVGPNTAVFDTSITDLGEWRAKFEQPAKKTWVGELTKGRRATDVG